MFSMTDLFGQLFRLAWHHKLARYAGRGSVRKSVILIRNSDGTLEFFRVHQNTSWIFVYVISILAFARHNISTS